MVRFILLTLLFTVTAFSQEFNVRAYTDTSEYLIGDHVIVHFEIEYVKGISFAEPAFRDSISNIDFIGAGKVEQREESGKVFLRYEVVLSRFDSSDIKIPPITWYYWFGEQEDRAAFLLERNYGQDTTIMKAVSNEVNFRISAVKVNIEEDIKDIKAPVTIPLDWKLILLFVLIVLLLIAAGVYVYLKTKKRREARGAPVIILPPHVIALSSLDELEKKNLWQKGMIKDFHSEITGIIRKYFEERFGLPALELTTGETLELLNNTAEAKSVLSDAEEFLNNADLVKFAKFIPVNDVNEMMMKKAYIIVEQTIPSVQEDEEEVSNVQ
jgi:hypothetical protein